MPVASATAIGFLGIDATRVDATQQHPLGMVVPFTDGTRRRYVLARGAIAANDALFSDTTHTTPYGFKTTSAATQPIAGVAPVAIADTKFGWVIISGKANVKVAAAIAAGAHLVTTAAAGTLDDVAAAAADAQAAAAGIGVTAFLDDSPSAGIALVMLHG